jgi:hypothetical protein
VDDEHLVSKKQHESELYDKIDWGNNKTKLNTVVSVLSQERMIYVHIYCVILQCFMGCSCCSKWLAALGSLDALFFVALAMIFQSAISGFFTRMSFSQE